MFKETHSKEKLCEVIENIDCLSQHAFSEINAIASLSLLAMESPDRVLGTNEDIARILHTIRNLSEVTQGNINYEAETVECNYSDERIFRPLGGTLLLLLMTRRSLCSLCWVIFCKSIFRC